MVRDCPHAYVTGTPTISARVNQPATGASVSSYPANQPARLGGQQGRGQRGHPVTQARLHAITPQEGRDSPEVIMGTLSIFGWPAYTLFDPGASHSFVSVSFASYLNVLFLPLLGEWQVSVPSGDVFPLEWVYRVCSVVIEGFSLTADLIPLEIISFDVILGMDFISNHRPLVD